MTDDMKELFLLYEQNMLSAINHALDASMVLHQLLHGGEPVLSVSDSIKIEDESDDQQQ